MGYLSAEDLLAGGALTHEVDIPPAVLTPVDGSGDAPPGRVRLRPLTVRDIQLLTKAARDDDGLLSILMLKEALVEPALSLEQINGMHAGLARFLLEELNRASGLAVEAETLAEAVQAPLARACFALASEFGWSPQEIGDLTVGQVLLYLEMAGQGLAEARPRRHDRRPVGPSQAPERRAHPGERAVDPPAMGGSGR